MCMWGGGGGWLTLLHGSFLVQLRTILEFRGVILGAVDRRPPRKKKKEKKEEKEKKKEKKKERKKGTI